MPPSKLHYDHAMSKKGKAGRNALKKTTAKGAYAPSAKKNFRKRRQPFVETKKREHTITAFVNEQAGISPVNHPLYALQPMDWAEVSNDDAFTQFNLASFNRIKQGIGEDQMVGDTIYGRYLKCKVEVKFPSNMNMLLEPNKVYLIQGWCTRSIGANAERGVQNGASSDALEVSQADVQQHIENSIKQYFNQETDRLRFRPKQETDVKILRKVELMPDLTNNTFLPPSLRGEAGFIGTNGAIPDVHKSFTWTINRKLAYTQGTGQDGKTLPQDNSAVEDIQNMYNNNGWLPFLILYSPQFQVYKDGETATGSEVKLQVRYNDCFWFGDS